MASAPNQNKPAARPVPAMDLSDFKKVSIKRSVTIADHFYPCKFAHVVNADVLKAMQDLGVVTSVVAA